MTKRLKLHILHTGGTISTTLVDGALAPAATDDALTEMWSARYGYADFTHSRPIDILSENISENDLYAVVGGIKEALRGNPDGIIVTHGSDTFDFTANYLACVFKGARLPIVLINSLYPLSDSRSNAFDNFCGAITFIRDGGGKGVFAANKNPSEDICRILRGESVLPADPNGNFMPFDGNFGCVTHGKYVPCEKPTTSDALSAVGDFSDAYRLDTRVLSVQTHALMDFGLLDVRSVRPRAVIIGLYHSGTICTAEHGTFAGFASECAELGIPVILAGAKKDGNSYSSMKGIPNSCKIAYDMSLGFATVLTMLSLGNNREISAAIK